MPEGEPGELDSLQRACAVGTELEQFFAPDGGGPISFPDLPSEQRLVCDYEADGEEPAGTAEVKSFSEMIQWFNVYKHIGVGIGWRIVERQALAA